MLDQTNTAIARRATVEDIVGHRNKALALFSDAHQAIAEASAAIEAARKEAGRASAGVTRYNYHQRGENESFLRGLKVPETASFMADARKMVDTDVWAHVIEITDLERLMDKKAKDQLNQQLLVDPPEATVENIMATLEQFMLDADTIFKRGIAECFSSLDRRFRSHDGWKIGSRVILSYAFNEWGSWNYNSNQRDTIQDIERTFLVLDGMKDKTYGGLAAAVERQRAGSHVRRQGYVETDYFRVRSFMNGNAHIWFKRDDLLERVNKLLGEYYGEAIPEERDPDPDTGLNHPKTALAKNYGYFPTPADLADEVVRDYGMLYQKKEPAFGEKEPVLRVLEPSAGDGALAAQAAKRGTRVDCIEVHRERAAALSGAGIYANVLHADFLALRPEMTGLYDRVLMNPPFDRERDIDHVVHALKFLKPDGHLCAIMSAGTEFRETRKAVAFRDLVEKKGGKFRDLPARSFASVGTNINTIILRVWNDGRRWWW